jgi:NAD(P) transhydrogenase subunit alpha
VLVGRHESRLSFILGILAVIAATSNIVGGFLITDRMLKMFKSSRPAKP